MYHNISYEKSSSCVTPENLVKQMEYIKRNGYDVITLDELAGSIKDKRRLKRNKVVITLDDGYEDNFKYAYPVFKKFGFAATIFLPTDYMGRKGYLTWDQIRLMSKDKISFGGHTKTHLYLGLVNDDKILREEIAGSKKTIERETGVPADYFCYPIGGFNERVKEIVKEAGYKGACTTNRGTNSFNRDIYELKRVKMTNFDMDKPFSFRLKLSGYYNLFRGRQDSY
ncbi:MAG: polysaccharide deacetylase family protein [Candidatus Omnitrophica bacterium]|nr:polysaccharide deacetylase family protein [Candidatus Omnitrophota bacterium]